MCKNTFKKKDIVNIISFKTGYSKNLISNLVDDLLYYINLNINSGNLILKNLGSFKVVQKNERLGRNPKTKKKYKISARKSVKFVPSLKISKNLKEFYE
mgnify:CR=1 FL=1